MGYLKLLTVIALYSAVYCSAANVDVGFMEEVRGSDVRQTISRFITNGVGSPYGFHNPVTNKLNPLFTYTGADILWTVEDWWWIEGWGYVGPICEDIDVSANGNYVLVSWNLNDERWELYDASGEGEPLWTYEFGDPVEWDLHGSISADGSVIACCVDMWLQPEGYVGALFKFNNGSGEPDWIYEFPYKGADWDVTSRPIDVQVTPDGSRIVCVVTNVIADPDIPHQLYIFDSSSDVPLLIADIPDEGTYNPYYGIDITDDGSLIAFGAGDRIYVYNDEGEQVNAFDNEPNWQFAPSLSPDGEWLVYGNYFGKIRLNQWNGSEFEQTWQYTLTGYLNTWVCPVDVVNDKIMVGTLMSDDVGYLEEIDGYVYMFDTSSPEPIWASENSGHAIWDVSLNEEDETIGLAASLGPVEGAGWRTALFNTGNPTPYFVMDESYPGSHEACDLSYDGSVGAIGGKIVHVTIMGSGGMAYCIESYDDTHIVLDFFGAKATEKGVKLEWAANHDETLYGFNIYREPLISTPAKAKTGLKHKINAETITGRSPYFYVDADVEPGTTYAYWLEAIDGAGVSERFGPVECTVGEKPAVLSLYQNAPNPAKGITSITFSLPERGPADIRVYDISGRVVAELGKAEYDAGPHEIELNVDNLANGVYVYRLTAAEDTLVRKMVVAR
jgi:hypothetical protein